MHIDELREYALTFPEVSEGFPFGENTLVFKVNGKIFLLMFLAGNPFSVNVKCDPEYAIELRERYAAISPGYHMNKKHWNTILIDGSVSDDLMRDCVRQSYDLVAKKKR